MSHRRLAVVSAVATVLFIAPAAVVYAADAPPSEATGTAASVTDTVTVGRSGAHADSGGGSATAESLRTGGALPPTTFGGNQSGRGAARGSRLQVVGGPATVWVLPWNTAVTEDGGARRAHADSAAAAATVDETALPAVGASVLRSDSDAAHQGAQSTGQSSSDGAVFIIGKNDVVLNVLHSDASTAGQGHSYLIAINGTAIGGSDPTTAICSAVPPSVVALTCLATTAGQGTERSTAAAASVASGRSVVSLSAVSGSQTAPAHVESTPVHQGADFRPAARPAGTVRGAVRAALRGGNVLPLTGYNPFTALLVALALVLVGADLVAVSRVFDRP